MPRSAPSIQSLERAFDILDLFQTGGAQTLSLKAICAATGLHTSTAHHLIATMVKRGYMDQDSDTRHYGLGSALLRLQSAVDDKSDLQKLGAPFVRRLVERTQEEAYLDLGIRSGWYCPTILSVPSPQPIRIVRPGGSDPALHATATGKCMLAFGGDEIVERYLRKVTLKAFTDHTLVEPDRVHQELDRVREQGVAYDHQEHVMGIGCIAAPVFDHTGAIVAALSISYPMFRADEGTVARWTNDVMEGSRALSERLGHVVKPLVESNGR